MFPTEEDYYKVPLQNEKILKILKFIFERKPGFDEVSVLL